MTAVSEKFSLCTCAVPGACYRVYVHNETAMTPFECFSLTIGLSTVFEKYKFIRI